MTEIIVGVGEARFSRDPNDVLVTYALGSCVACMFYDSKARVAAMAHSMLPDSTQSPSDVDPLPGKFAETAVPYLLRTALDLGAEKQRLVVSVAGGAQVMNDAAGFNIGLRNCVALRRALWKVGLDADAEDLGGSVIRTVRMDVGSGRVRLQSPDGTRWELIANRLRSLQRT